MRIQTTINHGHNDKIMKHVLKLGCMLSVGILCMHTAHAITTSECNWELNVLGELSDTNSGRPAINSRNKLLLGIVYKKPNAQYNNYYAFVTSAKYGIEDKDVIKQLGKLSVYPLRTIDSRQHLSIERGFYKVEKNIQPDPVIYLITAMNKIAPLERMGARISPLVNNQTLKRRGGSDFSGQLKTAVKISSLSENKIPDKGVQICSYMLN